MRNTRTQLAALLRRRRFVFPLALAGLSAIVLDGTAGRPLGLAYLAGVIVGVFVYAVQVG